jgi:hypothetical protein
MLHPATELRWISSVIGFGVFATAPIPRGTITWVQDALDQVFPQARAAVLPPPLLESFDRYSYLNGRGERILCWDHARFINHSCIPTVLSPGFEFDLALRDIQSGEEITTDYGALNLDASFLCACGTSTCRGEIRPDDPERLTGHWDRRVRSAFRAIDHVAQPLWSLLPDPAAVERVLDRLDPIPSIAMHRCPLPPALLALPLPAERAPIRLPTPAQTGAAGESARRRRARRR